MWRRDKLALIVASEIILEIMHSLHTPFQASVQQLYKVIGAEKALELHWSKFLHSLY